MKTILLASVLLLAPAASAEVSVVAFPSGFQQPPVEWSSALTASPTPAAVQEPPAPEVFLVLLRAGGLVVGCGDVFAE